MDDTSQADQPIFKALLVPHRSLGGKGFAILMGVLLVLWLSVAAFFWSLGAWPVVGFFGLDLLAVYIAFRLNYRQARQREEVSLSRTSLHIRKVPPSGPAQEFDFNPFWSRFKVERHAEIGVTRMTVEARQKQVGLGSFLNPDDRASFAEAFGAALATAKGR
ncbi:DUF2244 domain-containing protein [Nitratireductor thuwali]|uniref:DUF2244 domain-containing protein n=1 Tax=Nitratireductor thuwali TaxID=2267699 RepID=A0ABY5MJG3_9HYPH|nr:hypothetical protein NTH_02423 [Nitratireductor thuwali]